MPRGELLYRQHMEKNHMAFPADLSIWRQQIASSLASWLAERCEGAIAVDCQGQVIWINETYLEALALPLQQVLGRPIAELTPHTRMPEVLATGEPVLLDIFTVGERSFIISRVPVKDERGRIVGAIGFALYETRQHLKPLLAKFRRLEAELASVRQALTRSRATKYSLSDIIGHGAVMQETKRRARRVARGQGAVLLLGETGTGKELFAHAIHTESARSAGPFVALNVAAIPETLLESELFGAVGGAYTGADRRGREGKIKLAEGGSLFLDEIGDLPLSLQAKLLRVLQEKEFEALGSNQVQHIDVRIITATSRDLVTMVHNGQFRADLYYRLNVLPLTLPPLRQRREDLPALCEHILARIADHTGEVPRDIDPQGLAWLTRYDWPGNLRELWNVLEQAVTLFDTLTLGVNELQTVLPQASDSISPPTVSLTLQQQLAECERRVICDALATHQGNVFAAAKQLGIGRATLYKKIQYHQITSSSPSL